MTTSRALDGLLLLDKPADLSSHDVVHWVRKALGQKAVGHTGTLDPLATGLMVLVLGEATKLSDYLVATDKRYRLKVRFGVTTDTYDRTGKILRETPCALSEDCIRQGVADFQGEFTWPVPIFSAAKVDGKKLYEYARSGQEVEVPVKTMSFWGAQVEEVSERTLQVALDCSKGSFVRSWAAHLGEALGVGGVVDELRRLRVGLFNVDRALTLEQLQALPSRDPDSLGAAFVPMAGALPDWKSILAGPKEARLLNNGQIPRDLANRVIVEQKQAFSTGRPVFVKVLTTTGDLLAILAAESGQGLKIRRVFRGFT